jgi:outer membrane biosynthesis protein TonB
MTPSQIFHLRSIRSAVESLETALASDDSAGADIAARKAITHLEPFKVTMPAPMPLAPDPEPEPQLEMGQPAAPAPTPAPAPAPERDPEPVPTPAPPSE